MKNTRIFYTDEAHINMYEALPAENFKELFMAMLKYQYGDNSIIDTINNPVVKALFMREKADIDINEEKWEGRAKTNRTNGAKGGRPKKEKTAPAEEQQPSSAEGPQGGKPMSFGTQGELVDYLIDYRKNHSNPEMEYQRNILCSRYGFSQREVIDEYNKKDQLR